MTNNAVTKDMIAKLMDGQLGDDHLQDLQRMARKDTDRFQKYIELLQERVPWNEKVLLRLTDHLYIVQNETLGRTVRCDCGHDFGDYRVNWKLSTRVRVRRTSEEFEEVYTPAYSAPEPGWMTLREYYCPSCATQLAVEVVPPGYPPVFDMLPDLDSFYRNFLAAPLDDESPEWYEDRTNQLTAGWMKEAQNA